jgi:hypothetical protein
VKCLLKEGTVTKFFSMLTRHPAPKEAIENVKICVDEGIQAVVSRQDLNTDHEVRLRSVADRGSQRLLVESAALIETIAKEGM